MRGPAPPRAPARAPFAVPRRAALDRFLVVLVFEFKLLLVVVDGGKAPQRLLLRLLRWNCGAKQVHLLAGGRFRRRWPGCGLSRRGGSRRAATRLLPLRGQRGRRLCGGFLLRGGAFLGCGPRRGATLRVRPRRRAARGFHAALRGFGRGPTRSRFLDYLSRCRAPLGGAGFRPRVSLHRSSCHSGRPFPGWEPVPTGWNRAPLRRPPHPSPLCLGAAAGAGPAGRSHRRAAVRGCYGTVKTGHM